MAEEITVSDKNGARPTVAMDGDGDFVVGWENHSQKRQ